MTLYETIDLLKKIALKHPNIGSASEGNIYEYMNANPSIKYGVFFITQGTHSQDEIFNHFEFTLFYVDRLVDDMDENRLQIQSIGKEMLSNILTFFCEEFNAECENISFQPFTQRFVDETAGIYSTITIDMPKDIMCAEEYWNEDWVAPVTVIRNQDKRVTFTENGTYTIDYDPQTYTGLGTVEVDVNIDVDSYFENGYNLAKKEIIETAQDITITENGQYGDGETLYKTIDVNVVPKISVREYGIKFSQSTFSEVPEWADFEGVTDMEYMFRYCSNIQTIPLIDTSNVTTMYYMFQGCGKLQTIPLIDTSNVENMRNMFEDCSNLQTIPLIDTSNVVNMESMFEGCSNLQTIPPIDTSNVTNMRRMFYQYGGMQSLLSLPKFNVPKVTDISKYFYMSQTTLNNLTEVGGWENLKCNWNDNSGLVCLPNLTYQSCINVLNGLYDFVGNGSTETRTLKVHPNFLTTVGDEISIGTNKGWTIMA